MYLTFFFLVLHRTFIRLCCCESAKSCAMHAKTCSRVNVSYVLTCSRADMPCVLRCSYANVSCVLTCSRANVP